jgi:hypothetical protein
MQKRHPVSLLRGGVFFWVGVRKVVECFVGRGKRWKNRSLMRGGILTTFKTFRLIGPKQETEPDLAAYRVWLFFLLPKGFH